MIPNKLDMAEAIMSLADVDDTGLLHMGPLDMYARALGCTEDDAGEVFDQALDALVEDGRLEVVHGSYYEVQQLEEWRRIEEEERIEAEQQMLDEMQSYHMNIWG